MDNSSKGLSSVGNRSTHLPTWATLKRALLYTRLSYQGSCEVTTEPCTACRLLYAAFILCGQQWHCQEQFKAQFIKDYRALREAVRGSGTQVAFFSILTVKEKGFERTSQVQQINAWFWDCYSKGFGFLACGILINLVYGDQMGSICLRRGKVSSVTGLLGWWSDL